MATPTSSAETSRLAALEGQVFLTAHEALLKGILESEIEIALVAAPRREPISELFDLAAADGVQTLLRRHGVQLSPTPHAGRAIALASAAARSGRSALAVVPNDQLDHAMAILQDVSAESLPTGAGLCLLLEDRPQVAPVSGPRHAVARLGLPCLEPEDVGALRESVEQAMHLSRAGRTAVVLVVHHSILRSGDTISVGPNRVLDKADALVRRHAQSRRVRRAETGGVLRTARRLELNAVRCLPNPGERVPVGFLVVGPAEQAIAHLTAVLKLSGRLPVLHLRLINPVDLVVVERMAARCDQLIVLEPRPGEVEAQVLAVVERLRGRGERPATVWGRRLPPAGEGGAEQEMGVDDAVHPSLLARRIAHLIHAVRPGIGVVSRLAPEPPPLHLELPERGAGIGPAAAKGDVRALLEEVDHWLATGAPLEERGLAPTALAFDGVESEAPPPRQVMVEIWEAGRFQEEGISALRQATRDTRPWLFVICALGAEDEQDLERLARAVVPAERADRARIVLGSLSDRGELRDALREACLDDRLTVMVLQDGPPAQYDVGGLDRARAAIDRLGFEPKQRLVRSAEHACLFHQPAEAGREEMRQARDDRPLRTSFSIDPLPRRFAGRWRVGFRPLLESVQVVRTRPPAAALRLRTGVGLPLPTPVHGGQSEWRAHLAGYRGRTVGPVAAALCVAGRRMGYAVGRVHDPELLGASRRAWVQILFTNPRVGEESLRLTARIPFGEADLLLGVDPIETLRSLSVDPALKVASPDRTCAVVNRGELSSETVPRPVEDAIGSALAGAVRPNHLVVADVASACRAWFRTDRLTDLALLGLAFQRGYAPVSLDAMEAGIAAAEETGFGRAREAFQFGRRLAVDERLLSRPRTDARDEVDQLVRRSVLLLRRTPFGGRTRAERFERMIRRSLATMPGLTETAPGRQARCDIVLAAHRCLVWGGLEWAERFCNLLTSLYLADRGDKGRALTRNAVLPLAEAVLIREPLYVLTMATGAEQRRLTRIQLNVKPKRGDQIEHRILIRVELVALHRRFRLEARTGEGTARFLSRLRYLVPDSLRGGRRERELRQAVMDLVTEATAGSTRAYTWWHAILHAMHRLAADDQLRGLTAAELRRRVEDEARNSSSPSGIFSDTEGETDGETTMPVPQAKPALQPDEA